MLLAGAAVVALGATATDAPSRREAVDRGAAGITAIFPPPDVTARGWLVFDAGSQEPVAGEESATPRPIASLAKLMTALVVESRVDADTLVTIPAAINDLPADAARMDARVGEEWPAKDLLQALLVYSANDAAIALASHVTKGDVPAFVALMNQRAEELGLDSTKFASPTGLDTPGESNTSTPADLVDLVRAVLDVDTLRATVGTEKITLTRPGGGGKPIELTNRNPLLGTYDGVDGVKTGFTDAAGYMLAVHQDDSETGGELIVTTFGSTSEKTRVTDMRALLDWGRALRTEVRVVEGGTPLGSIPVTDGGGDRIDVFACDDLLVHVRAGQQLVQEAVVPRHVTAPVEKGDEVGELRVRVGARDAPTPEDPDEIVLDPDTVPICSDDSVEKLGRIDRLVDHARDYRSAWSAGVDEVEDTWSSLRRSIG